MSHLKLQSQSQRSKTYRQVLMQRDCRRNQFTLLKERSQDIVHRFEHRLHEVLFFILLIIHQANISYEISMRV